MLEKDEQGPGQANIGVWEKRTENFFTAGSSRVPSVPHPKDNDKCKVNDKSSSVQDLSISTWFRNWIFISF